MHNSMHDIDSVDNQNFVFLKNMTCPGCPTGQKETASAPPPPGVCCPTIACEPIACTIDGAEYLAGETIPTINPCEISW